MPRWGHMIPEQVNERIATCVARFVALGYTLDEITIHRDVQGEYPAQHMVTASARKRDVDEPDCDIDIGHL